MSAQRIVFSGFFLLACVAAVYAVRYVNLRIPLGPQCELKESFASVGRPAYSHHCVCWGIKYAENPPPVTGSDAVRCFGIVRKRWTDTDETAVQEIAARERRAASSRAFEKLSPEAQERVQANYHKLQQAFFRSDFPRMLELAHAILGEVDDFGDTRAFETVARKSLGDKAIGTSR